jgi:hypothetical protein
VRSTAAAGTLAATTLALYSAAAGGGNALTGTTGTLANLTGADRMQAMQVTLNGAVQTGNTIVIRQIAASANTGTIDMVIPIIVFQ